MEPMKPMGELKNGATLLQREGNVVLARTHRDYVTWEITDEGDCYWGHYFMDDLSEAMDDFRERVAKAS